MYPLINDYNRNMYCNVIYNIFYIGTHSKVLVECIDFRFKVDNVFVIYLYSLIIIILYSIIRIIVDQTIIFHHITIIFEILKNKNTGDRIVILR